MDIIKLVLFSAGFFPISGGALKDNMIYRNEDTSSLMIIGGKSTNDSAFLQAYGKNNNLYPGVFSLNANIGNGVKSLVGSPDGKLTWNNNDLAGTALTGKSLNNNGYVSYASGLILQWGMITPGSNTSSFGVTLPISFTTVGAYALTAISQDGLSNLRYNPTDINTGIFYFTNSNSNNRVIKFIAIGH